VLAPAGCGKTAVLSEIIQRRSEEGVEQKKMACFTFTNRAAEEMGNRVREKLPHHEVFIGNFHAFAIAFLKQNRLMAQNMAILDEEDQDQLIRELAQGLQKEQGKTFGQLKVEEVLTHANRIRMLELGIHSHYHPKKTNAYEKSPLNLVAAAYHELKASQGYLDYDDLLALTHAYLKEGMTLKTYAFDFLIVDETQDLNDLQHSIIQLLCHKSTALIYFADMNQAIFSFMGANVSRLKWLIQKCGEKGRLFYFSQNYRSPSHLLKIFNAYAKHHFEDLYIPSFAQSESEGKLLTARLSRFKQRYVENVNWLLGQEDGLYSTTAILARSNKDAEAYTAGIKTLGVPYFRCSGFDLFRRKEMKFFMAFMGALSNEFDKLAWTTLVYNLFSGHSLKSCRETVNAIFDAHRTPLDLISLGTHAFRLSSFIQAFEHKTIVVFDTETTGTDTQSDDIIQIAGCKIKGGQVIDTFEVFMDTDKDLAESEKIHHISKEKLVREGVSHEEGLSQFLGFIDGSAILAHNLAYDLDTLNANITRYLPGIPPLAKDFASQFDSLYLAKVIKPGLPLYKLEFLIGELGLEGVVNSHNAMDDVLATVKLTQKLYGLGRDLHGPSLNGTHLQHAITRLKELFQHFGQALDQPMHLGDFAKNFFDFTGVDRNVLDGEISKFMTHASSFTHQAGMKETRLIDRIKKFYPIYDKYKENDLMTGEERVCISTIHKSKGLQFDNVLIPDFPSYSFDDPDERARLFYVAMTRAKKRLFVPDIPLLHPVSHELLPLK